MEIEKEITIEELIKIKEEQDKQLRKYDLKTAYDSLENDLKIGENNIEYVKNITIKEIYHKKNKKYIEVLEDFIIEEKIGNIDYEKQLIKEIKKNIYEE